MVMVHSLPQPLLLAEPFSLVSWVGEYRQAPAQKLCTFFRVVCKDYLQAIVESSLSATLKRKDMRHFVFLMLFTVFFSKAGWAARAPVDDLARNPYRSALVIDAATGRVLFDDQSSTLVYPASVLKLMDLLVIFEQLEKGTVRLDDLVPVTPESAKMGGSQVYLDPKEQFSVEDLLYALAVQSANDAAVALAIHVAGSTEGFISLMNRRAQELGMKDTEFHSVHGLPPSKGQKPDVTTAKDLAILGRELAKRQEIFKYTGTIERPFRQGKFIMRNHNHLLETVNGCDGFKTGYFQAAGFSIVATAKRDGVRIIAIVMGSRDRKTRDVNASELLAKGFALASSVPKVAKDPETIPPAIEKGSEQDSTAAENSPLPAEKHERTLATGGGWPMFFWGLGVGLTLSALLAFYLRRRRSARHTGYRSYR